MSGIVLRWGVPALVTVVGGTSLAISSTGADMQADLAARAATVLQQPELAWATVDFESRDAILSGTATDQQMIDDALAHVAAVHGIRSVRSDVVLAEYVSPFPFHASIKDGAITLSGGVPDETAHAEIALATGSADDDLKLLSGAPPRSEWRAAVDYGLSHLEAFDEGEFSLADLNLTIKGRASSPQSFDALALLAETPPPGATVVARDISPALASPFEWHAEFDGSTVRVSGYSPSEGFADELRSRGVGGRPVATSLTLASGAPEGFETRARLLLENLVLLEQGSVDISDTTATLVGAPADAATIERVRIATTGTGITVELAPPRVEAYAFVATRGGDGTIALTGFVPDAPTRARLEALDDVDAGGLELARGAPERFDSAVEFGLDLLGHMSEGTFSLSSTSLTIAGRATTVSDFTAVETTLALGAPQGLILASANVKPPLATPFTWEARKDEDGHVRMAGYVPSQLARDALQSAAASLSEDRTTLADGNPPGFEREAVAALGILPLLKTASITYDGERWVMSGAVDTPQAAFSAEQAFVAAGLRDAGWSFSVDLPAPATPAALPIIDPYVLRAQKDRDGTVVIGGFVPSEGLKQTLLRRAGPRARDNTTLGAGNPMSFVPNALAGIDALVALNEGTLAFDGREWTLSGEVAKGSDRLAIEGSLQAATDVRGWSVAIQALDAAPVVAPYRWSATKSENGRIALAGYVTTEELKQFIALRAGDAVEDSTAIASGEPAGFIGDALAGLEALNYLVSGSVSLEDGNWTLSGIPRTAPDADLAVAALGTATAGGAGWAKQLGEPLAAAPPAEPDEPAAPTSEPEEAADPAATAPTQVSAPQTAPVDRPATATDEQAPVAAPAAPEAEDGGIEMASATPADTPAADSTPDIVETPEPLRFAFSASKPLGGTIALKGDVPADAARRYFGVIAGMVPTEGVTIGTSLPGDFITNADAGIRLLASLDAGEFGLAGSQWVLNGQVETEEERRQALSAIEKLPAASTWETSITLLPPLAVCQEKVGAFASRNAILFQSGSARIADESLPAIDELAGYLSSCPEAAVNVEGHTDADGDDDANLALSVARAEAVVEALIEHGIAFQRLYAVGYGESLPVADNDTRAGKAANRRIAFSFQAGVE